LISARSIVQTSFSYFPTGSVTRRRASARLA
jgi:hypothetical protein